MNGKRFFTKGFTLLELMVVLAIIALLLTIAAPRYFIQVDRAKEAALKQTLFIVRDAIDKFKSDKGHYPYSLDELVSGQYLRQRPIDPVTNRSDTWKAVTADSEGRISDIRSGSDAQALDGSAYAEW